MTKFQPLQKIHKLYLGISQVQSLSRLHAAKYLDKSSRPLECTPVHMFHKILS